MRLVTFESGGSLFGIPASEVRSVLPGERPAAIPGMPGFLVGLITIRGDLVPVVDLQCLLDGQATEISQDSCLVVADVQGTDVALLVPRLGPSLLLGSDRIDPSPMIGGAAAVPYVADVARLSEGLCLVLDVPVLLAGHAGVISRCFADANEGEEGGHDEFECHAAA